MGKYNDTRLIWLWVLSPLVCSIALVLIFAEFNLIEFHFAILDWGTLTLFLGLLVTTFIVFVLFAREGFRRIQAQNETQLRIAFAEEHIRFLRRLDHEIKNPLMGIQTALDNLMHEQDMDKRQKIGVSIDEQIERLTRLVADLRRIGDMEQYEIERFPVDTEQLLREVFSMVADDENVTHRNLFLEIPPRLPALVGDYDLLLLAIYNVLMNAAKYTNDDDSIQLFARIDNMRLQISVIDTGPGIQPTDLSFVWDELYRSQQVKEISGSGIGLALVRRIVERHQGDVSIKSTPNKDTTVTLYLPIVPQ